MRPPAETTPRLVGLRPPAQSLFLLILSECRRVHVEHRLDLRHVLRLGLLGGFVLGRCMRLACWLGARLGRLTHLRAVVLGATVGDDLGVLLVLEDLLVALRRDVYGV